MGSFDFSKKLYYHPQHLVSLQSRGRPFPITMEVDLTNLCNHKCSFCYERAYLKRDGKQITPSTLEWEVLEKVLREAKLMGVKGVSYTGGGEPMLHPRFLDIIDYSNKIGLDVGVITNGSMIETTHEFLNKLCTKLQWLRISVGGGDRESYKRVQGIDDFDKVMWNIRGLSLRNHSLGFPLFFGVRMLINKDNRKSLKSFVNNVSKYPVSYIQFARDQYDKDDSFWKEVCSELENSYKPKLREAGIKMFGTGYEKKYDRKYPKKCYAHFYQFAINSQGYILFCKNCRGEKRFHSSKTIYEASLSDIWQSSETIDLEWETTPQNCGMVCKNMALNTAVEDILNPDQSVQPNFVN